MVTQKSRIKLMLVDNDRNNTRIMTSMLKNAGFEICHCLLTTDALHAARRQKADIAIINISDDAFTGYNLCTQLKSCNSIPVIFISSHHDETSVVAGLEAGADDYITIPLRPRECISRIKTVLRRRDRFPTILRYGNITVDTIKGKVSKNGQEIFLSALEYRILLVFITHRGQILSRPRLLEEIWNMGGDYVSDNTLTVYIKRIREKIEDDPSSPRMIKTIRGQGYKTGL
ncbi:MAG: response regulator transcription factor [Oscillospiraceae bacterium]|nr:response regulator transcription factor [Oscillospiraceae bacterium]